jgi:hypothetical protein
VSVMGPQDDSGAGILSRIHLIFVAMLASR